MHQWRINFSLIFVLALLSSSPVYADNRTAAATQAGADGLGKIIKTSGFNIAGGSVPAIEHLISNWKTINNPCPSALKLIRAMIMDIKEGSGINFANSMIRSFDLPQFGSSTFLQLSQQGEYLSRQMSRNKSKSIRALRKVMYEIRQQCYPPKKVSTPHATVAAATPSSAATANPTSRSPSDITQTGATQAGASIKPRPEKMAIASSPCPECDTLRKQITQTKQAVKDTEQQAANWASRLQALEAIERALADEKQDINRKFNQCIQRAKSKADQGMIHGAVNKRTGDIIGSTNPADIADLDPAEWDIYDGGHSPAGQSLDYQKRYKKKMYAKGKTRCEKMYKTRLKTLKKDQDGNAKAQRNADKQLKKEAIRLQALNKKLAALRMALDACLMRCKGDVGLIIGAGTCLAKHDWAGFKFDTQLSQSGQTGLNVSVDMSATAWKVGVIETWLEIDGQKTLPSQASRGAVTEHPSTNVPVAVGVSGMVFDSVRNRHVKNNPCNPNPRNPCNNNPCGSRIGTAVTGTVGMLMAEREARARAHQFEARTSLWTGLFHPPANTDCSAKLWVRYWLPGEGVTGRRAVDVGHCFCNQGQRSPVLPLPVIPAGSEDINESRALFL